MGAIDAALRVEHARRYALDLLGPLRGDNRRQAQEHNGFAAADLAIDGAAQPASCPSGCTSSPWNPTSDRRENPVMRITFALRDGHAWAPRSDGTDGHRRWIRMRPRAHYEALPPRRNRQRTETFTDAYAKRAGVEGTVWPGVRWCAIGHARERGLATTRRQHLATAAALNRLRGAEWLDETPHAQTRHAPFERRYRQAQAA